MLVGLLITILGAALVIGVRIYACGQAENQFLFHHADGRVEVRCSLAAMPYTFLTATGWITVFTGPVFTIAELRALRRHEAP